MLNSCIFCVEHLLRSCTLRSGRFGANRHLFKVPTNPAQFLYLLKVPTKAAGGGWGSESPSDDRHLPDYHFQSYIASIFAILHFYSFISCIKITSAMHDHVLGFKPSAGSLKADHEDEEGGNHEDNTWNRRFRLSWISIDLYKSKLSVKPSTRPSCWRAKSVCSL